MRQALQEAPLGGRLPGDRFGGARRLWRCLVPRQPADHGAGERIPHRHADVARPGNRGGHHAATVTASTTAPTASVLKGSRSRRGGSWRQLRRRPQGATVDGIQCAPFEQLAYHIHAHLQVYVTGSRGNCPAAIGLVDPVAQQTPYGPFYGAQKCYYWLHTHATDGDHPHRIPDARDLHARQLLRRMAPAARARGVSRAPPEPCTRSVNGRPWIKSPRAIPLKRHKVIQLAVGRPIPPFHKVNWGTSGLEPGGLAALSVRRISERRHHRLLRRHCQRRRRARARQSTRRDRGQVGVGIRTPLAGARSAAARRSRSTTPTAAAQRRAAARPRTTSPRT